jgi:dihydrofolate synthase/folylpolyglutamate synthase
LTDAREYRETLVRLYERRRFGIRPGLETIGAILDGLGRPERRFSSLHITGSKGKGSVAAFAAEILGGEAGRVGLFTSPHLVSFRERIRIGNRTIPPSDVADGVARVEEVAERLQRSGRIDRPPTFFEVTTALAFEWFARQGVERAVVEVGLGGRLDATNVLRAPVGVVTTIELEHSEILGPTLGHIAREKAGIFHPGMRGVLGESKAEAVEEIERTARALGVPLWRLGREIRLSDRELVDGGQRFSLATPLHRYDSLEIGLLGLFQPPNAALAVAAAERFAEAQGFPLPERAVRDGLRRTRWRGRLERIATDPDLYVDVAHTPESARALAASLAEIHPFADPEETVLVFGCLRGKRADAMLDSLATLARTAVVVPIRSDRSCPVDELRRVASGRFPRVVQAPSVERGLPLARAATGPEEYTLVAGSDYLIGEVLSAIEGRPADEPDLSDPGLRGPGREPASLPRPIPRRS